MRVLRLFPLFALSLLLNSLVLPLAGPAYAGCCMCGTCSRGCTCPGVGGCKWCAAPGSENLQVNAAFSDRTLDLRVVRESVQPIAINSRSVDRLIRRAGTSQCGRNNYRLKVIQDDENVLKLDQGFLKYPASQDNVVALQVTEKNEK
jgi:hypothetical protein